jgi:LPXTG-motif cell wall-anchored protein
MPSRLIIAYVLIALMAAAAAAGLLYYLRKKRERERILRGHGHRRQHRH